MIRRLIRSETKYLCADVRATSTVQFMLCAAYLVLYFYCVWKKQSLDAVPYEFAGIIAKLASTYIFVRLLITGISLPNNIFSIEINHRGLANKASLYNGQAVLFLTVRIIIKCLFSLLISTVSFLLIINALGLMVNLGNYLLVFALSLLEMTHLLSIGFILCIVMQKFEIRREYIFIFEMFFLFLFIWNDSYNHCLPTSVLLSLIESCFTNDLLYSQYSSIDIVYEIPYLIGVGILSVLLICLSNHLLSNVIINSQSRTSGVKGNGKI